MTLYKKTTTNGLALNKGKPGEKILREMITNEDQVWQSDTDDLV